MGNATPKKNAKAISTEQLLTKIKDLPAQLQELSYNKTQLEKNPKSKLLVKNIERNLAGVNKLLKSINEKEVV